MSVKKNAPKRKSKIIRKVKKKKVSKDTLILINELIECGVIGKSVNGFLSIENQVFVKKKTIQNEDSPFSDLGTIKRKSPKKHGARYKENPSQRRQYLAFKGKVNKKSWNSHDFVGYYLHSYLKLYNEEDVEMCLKSFDDFVRFNVMCLNFLRDALRGDKIFLHEYLEWVFKEYLTSSDSDWLGQVNFWIIFDNKRAMLLKKYKGLRVAKNKKRKSKDQGWSDKSKWDKYINEKS